VKHDKPQLDEVAQLQASLELVERSLAFEPVVSHDVFLKWQVQRRRGKLVLPKPTGNVAGDRSVGIVERRERRM
jgi:hypothetical protein